MSKVRCAIYTRKSTEEGLEQEFNSLHAQRDACEAYVRSQASEGWIASVAEYDDGGYSGGSTNRPGLQRLLTDIHRGEVDVVVVYKVDRLTRSLSDFAKIVDLFDRHKVSFVSVTQAFNTTTSMGRLTLNMLLSFSQFEREITAERIRDKIAASKAKGLWMGGRPPLGYDGVGRKLVINTEEAKLVRHIYQRYLELGSVLTLTVELKTKDVRSKRWTNKQGLEVGGAMFSRGALYHLLANPVYRGTICHGELRYENSHPAIIEEATWPLSAPGWMPTFLPFRLRRGSPLPICCEVSCLMTVAIRCASFTAPAVGSAIATTCRVPHCTRKAVRPAAFRAWA